MTAARPPSSARIPLWIKLACTGWVAVLVPVYWRSYGPQNFLFFCDIALLLTVAGLWLQSPLLIGTQAVAILLPQSIWIADVVCHLSGHRLLGLTDYVFEPHYPVLTRLLSTFHGWLPVLLLWLVRRVGYDRRSLVVQTVLGMALLVVCYTCFVPPGTPGSKRAFNINYVYGFKESVGQIEFAPRLWFQFVLFGIPLLIYLPTHLVLMLWAPAKTGVNARSTAPPANPADRSPPELSPPS